MQIIHYLELLRYEWNLGPNFGLVLNIVLSEEACEGLFLHYGAGLNKRRRSSLQKLTSYSRTEEPPQDDEKHKAHGILQNQLSAEHPIEEPRIGRVSEPSAGNKHEYDVSLEGPANKLTRRCHL